MILVEDINGDGSTGVALPATPLSSGPPAFTNYKPVAFFFTNHKPVAFAATAPAHTHVVEKRGSEEARLLAWDHPTVGLLIKSLLISPQQWQ